MSVPLPILVHGSGGDHRVWAGVAARLPGALALDLPGHPEGPAARSLAELAAALATGIEGVAGPRVLVGHSLGGAAAMEVARTRPELVDGLVLVATGARLPVPDHAMDRLAADFPGERDRLLDGFVADPAGPAAEAARAALDSCGPASLMADYEACRTVDLRGRLHAVRAPALVVAGAEDPLTPVWLAEELARELPQAGMVVLRGARHMPMADAPATLAGLIAAYLARVELTRMGA